jgi:hypothetical protein
MTVMPPAIRRKALALLIAAAFTLCIAGVASIPHCEFFGVLFAPGILLGALVFPQGIEGDHGIAFLLAVGIVTALLLWLPILRVCQLLSSHRS